MRLVCDVIERIECWILTYASEKKGTLQPSNGTSNVRNDRLGNFCTYRLGKNEGQMRFDDIGTERHL